MTALISRLASCGGTRRTGDAAGLCGGAASHILPPLCGCRRCTLAARPGTQPTRFISALMVSCVQERVLVAAPGRRRRRCNKRVRVYAPLVTVLMLRFFPVDAPPSEAAEVCTKRGSYKPCVATEEGTHTARVEVGLAVERARWSPCVVRHVLIFKVDCVIRQSQTQTGERSRTEGGWEHMERAHPRQSQYQLQCSPTHIQRSPTEQIHPRGSPSTSHW